LHSRLGRDLDLGNRLEGRDHGALGLLVTSGGARLEERADLGMTKLVPVATRAEVVEGRAEGSVVKSG
jgi:hypothetical protein